MIKEISVAEVHFHLHRNGAADQLSSAQPSAGEPEAGTIIQPTRTQGEFPHSVSCWFGWSTKLLGLQMKNATNEQPSLRRSPPQRPVTCQPEGTGLSSTATRHLFLEVPTAFSTVLLFSLWHLKCWELAILASSPPIFPQSRPHHFSTPASFCSPHILPSLSLAPLCSISPFPWLPQDSFCSSTPN